MSTNGSSALIDGIKQAYAEAEAEGRDRPGRPTLVKMLANPPEITEHQVRKAKELVDEELTSPPPAPTSDTPATPPADEEHRPATGQGTHPQTAGGSPDPAAASPTPATRQAAARPPRPWPLALIGLAAAVAVWSGWVGLGEMAGFGPINVLPGIGSGWTLNSAIVLPISVEAYAAYALRVWLSTSYHSDRTIRFARTSTITSLVVGGAAQVAYHLLEAAGYVRAPWVVTMLVSLVPVLVLGIASALAKLVAADRQAGGRA